MVCNGGGDERPRLVPGRVLVLGSPASVERGQAATAADRSGGQDRRGQEWALLLLRQWFQRHEGSVELLRDPQGRRHSGRGTGAVSRADISEADLRRGAGRGPRPQQGGRCTGGALEQ